MTARSTSRYDAVAEWYVDSTSEWEAEPALGTLDHDLAEPAAPVPTYLVVHCRHEGDG